MMHVDTEQMTTPSVGNQPGQRTDRGLKPLHVLLVEDEPVTAMILTERLRGDHSAQFEICVATTLKGALEHLSAGDPDLILLDLTLPDSQGLATLDHVRTVNPYPPIVILTGCDDEDLAIQAMQNGAQDYLVKGVDDGLLVRSVRYAIERARSFAALRHSQQELERTQMQLIQVEKFDAVGRLAAGIAHEIRNPLAVIQMGIDVLKQMTTDLEDSPEEILEDMEDAVGRSGSIITGLLEFCMPAELTWSRVNLNEVILEALPMVRHSLGVNKVKLELNLADALPQMTVDCRRIQEVVLVLVINAMDAMAEVGGGSLRLTTEHRSAGGDHANSAASTVEFRVEDTGPGVSLDILDNVFDPFLTTKPVGAGTGLGLSITKNLVELHGGTITLKNKDDGTGAIANVVFKV